MLLAYVDKISEKYNTSIYGLVTKGCNLTNDTDTFTKNIKDSFLVSSM